MQSRIIGHVEFEKRALQGAVDAITELPSSPAYGDYAIGNWRTYSLWNRTGRAADGVSVESDDPARPTEIGAELPYINDLIRYVFLTKHIRSARIFAASSNSIIIPHRDYLEFGQGFTRIHVPLQVDEWSLSSEEEVVFRQRLGEVWFLDGHPVHSGGGFSQLQRLILVIDCDPSIPFDGLFAPAASFIANGQPTFIQRPDFEAQDYERLLRLADLLNETNWKDVVAILAKVHFRRKIGAAALYDWLDDIARLSGQAGAVQQAQKIRRFFITDGPTVIDNPWE